MNDFLLFLISWVIGWVIYSIGYYIYDVYIDKNNTSKKLLIYNAFKNGIIQKNLLMKINSLFLYLIIYLMMNIMK